MIDHRRALNLAATALDFPLDPADRVLLDRHVRDCTPCRAELAGFGRDAARLAALPAIAPPSWVRGMIGRPRRSNPFVLLAAAVFLVTAAGLAVMVGSGLLRDRTAVVVPTSQPSHPEVTTPGPTPTLIPLPRTLGWSNGAAMSAGRAFHAAARLLDGTVLLVGGTQPLAFGELYDPATDAFRQVALDEPFGRGAATLLLDGRVLVAGGDVRTAEVYDPATGLWSTTGPMVSRLGRHPEILLADGRVLAVGGQVSGGVTKSVEVFDPTTNQWSEVAALSSVRVGHTLALLPDGRVLVAGGTGSLTGSAATDTVEIFDPSTGTFTAGPPMNHPRTDHTATVLMDGRVLVVGGHHGNDVLQSAEIFDPATGTWTETASAIQRRDSHSATLLPDGRVLIAGGYSQGTRSAEIYDPVSGTWLETAEMTAVRGFHTATLLVDGRVLVAGGIDETQAMLASTELWLGAPLTSP